MNLKFLYVLEAKQLTSLIISQILTPNTALIQRHFACLVHILVCILIVKSVYPNEIEQIALVNKPARFAWSLVSGRLIVIALELVE